MPSRRARSSTIVAILLCAACDAPRAPRVHDARDRRGRPDVELASTARPVQKPAATSSLEQGFATVAQRVAPAVVSISSTVTLDDPHGALLDDPMFERVPSPGPRRARAEGSGVIVSDDGLVLTNNHVVENASEVLVTLADGREQRARVLGVDPKTDVAVLDIEGTDLPHVAAGDSDAVKVGEFALAIGNPFGVGQTVTLGIISAVGRGELGIVDYEDFLQTDAAINPGNSGGALVNARGELIGIATAILTGGTHGNQGVGFAVPTKMAMGVLEQIKQNGRVVRGWLGVAVQDVTPSLQEALGLRAARGALVGDVVPTSPAAKAGLQRGDVVVSMGGAELASSRELRLRVSETRPGTTTELLVQGGGRRFDVAVRLGELPADEARPPPRRATTPDPRALGLAFRELDDALRRQLSVPTSVAGVLVVGVEEGSPADEAGVLPGDVVVEAERQAVTKLADVQAIAARKRGGDVLFLLWREGSTRYVVVER
jgi:serine protease Do